MEDEAIPLDLADLNPVIAYRELLADVLNHNRLLGEGAEIGVQYAPFSEYLLDHWKGRLLHSIDPWKFFPGGDYRDQANREQDAQDAIHRAARARLARFGERSRIHRLTSAGAAPLFTEGQLDFAYIDAQHHYEAVCEDLALWFPKVRRGGILGGHDYIDGEFVPHGVFGVRRAVREFAAARGLTVLTTGAYNAAEEPFLPSWFLVKP